jgi:hypothetical protein
MNGSVLLLKCSISGDGLLSPIHSIYMYQLEKYIDLHGIDLP